MSSSRAADGEEDGYWRQVNGEQLWFPSPPVNEAAGAVEPGPLVQYVSEASSASPSEANTASSSLPTSTGMSAAASSGSDPAATESNDPNASLGGGTPAGGPESVVDAAKEYDAWKASIGGQDAPAFLSFAEWKERHLAEKEREEQEKKERRKKEKLKEREEKKKNSTSSIHPSPGQTQRATASDQPITSPTNEAPNLSSASTKPAEEVQSVTSASADLSSREQSPPTSSALDDSRSIGTNASAVQDLGTSSFAASSKKSSEVSDSPSSPSSSSAATAPVSRVVPPRTEDPLQATSTPLLATTVGGQSPSSPPTPPESPSSARDESQDQQSREQASSSTPVEPSDQARPNDTDSSAQSAVPDPQRIEMKMVAPGGTVVKGHVQELLADEGGATPAVGNPSTLLATLKHRWNFASLDCAAVIHRANPSAKFASSILSEKKDRYMLSPCPGASDGDAQGQFVIVELCDEIKIDTLVLANFEFFSRMFKRFQVRASKNLMDDVNNWYDLGTFRARNLRGLQVFNVHPPSGDRQFFRYMRIDFQEHYGQEYYCPLSLLRVYGLTQLDDFKKEEEESQRLLAAMDNEDADLDLDEELDQEEEQRAAHHDAAAAIKTGLEPNGSTTPFEAGDSQKSNGQENATQPFRSEEQAYMAEKLNAMMERSLHGEANDRYANESASEDDVHPSETDLEANYSTPTMAAGKNSSGATSSGTFMAREMSSTPSTSPSASVSLQPEPVGATSTSSAAADATPQPSSASAPPPSAFASATASTQSRPAAATASTASSSGGESIYRAITKRLNALEANATLSLQYMEHNGQMLLDVFAKMEKKQDDRLGEMLRMLNASNWRQIEALVSVVITESERLTNPLHQLRNDVSMWIYNGLSSSSTSTVNKLSQSGCSY